MNEIPMQPSLPNHRRLLLTLALILALGLLWLAQATARSTPAGATTKKLSTNFTLVNMTTGATNGEIRYYRADGTAWRATETFQFSTVGEQLIKRQYDVNEGLAEGRGSVVISATGAVGAVVQILAREYQPTSSGAYVAVDAGAATVYIPLVMRQRVTANGVGNSQIYVQNASQENNVAVEIDLIDPTGVTTFQKSLAPLAAGSTALYELASEAATNLPDGWFGSAVVRTTTPGGAIAAISNLFTGEHGLQTFNAFASKRQRWLAPLFTARLANSLSTPLAVQNLSGQMIPAGGIGVNCQGDAASPVATLTLTNTTAVNQTATYFFNPITDSAITEGFFGACTINTAGYDTVAFVQMRFAQGSAAAAYEALPGDSTNRAVTIPLYAKRLACGFATAVTIQNVNANVAAHVDLVYKGGDGAPNTCSLTQRNVTIPAGGSLIHNHRLASGPGAVPDLGDMCFGTLTATSSDQPIEAFVQMTNIGGCSIGDPFMAHSALAQSGAGGSFHLPAILNKQ
jgi:hypothetical protein